MLRSAFRAEDMIARIGGDEFVVLLPDAGEQAGAAALRRIKRSLQVHNEIHSPPPLSMAVGVATAGVGDQLVDALRQADRRMYADKDSAVV